MTFDTFVTANNNVSAVELLLRVCRNSPFQSNFICIYGGDGQGKTHLLNATEHEIKRFHPERNIVLVNMVDLAITLMKASRRGIRSEFIDFLSQIDTLLIDDVQFCEADSQTQTYLFELLEKRLKRTGHRLILSCDVKPSELQLSETRLKSAMDKIMIGELKPPDIAERAQIVLISSLRFAGGINLPAEVRSYIAENVTENIRELKAAVIQLIAVAGDMNKEICLELTRDIVSPAKRNVSQKPEKNSDELKGMADKGTPGNNDYAKLLKEMIRSAQNNDEHALANQIALSQMTKRLRYDESAGNRPLIAELQLALQAIREGDPATASELMQSHDIPSKQSSDSSISKSENSNDGREFRYGGLIDSKRVIGYEVISVSSTYRCAVVSRECSPTGRLNQSMPGSGSRSRIATQIYLTIEDAAACSDICIGNNFLSTTGTSIVIGHIIVSRGEAGAFHIGRIIGMIEEISDCSAP